ncbi:hypothetical protein [Deinococcus sp.]
MLSSTRQDGIGIVYSNAAEQLPSWISGDLKLDGARQTLPSSFFQVGGTR